MCGICGQLSLSRERPVDRRVIEAMARSIAHRGPDDDGFHVSGPVGLGFRRLSIIDLSGGHQPMANEDETVWLVFNGEIYNFQALREELIRLGHSFRTRSDTEVIIHGYEQWGDDVLQHLNGMFGLALWDDRRERLLLARDAMGIKPVYYAIRPDSISFGSEIRAVLAGLGERPAVDPLALNLFLRYRYTPAPLTMYKDIRKLAAGTRLVCERGLWQVSRWYAVQPTPLNPAPSDADAAHQLLDLYKRSVERHLISDVPVGLLLSGGLDSGLLLGLMQAHGRDWQTYTVGYGSSFKDDELTDAAVTAGIYDARNSAVRLDRSTFEEVLPRVVSFLEEPVASSSIVPMYLVCQRARVDVKVALCGQGPDELFGGYTRHLGVAYGRYWRSLPHWLRAPTGAALVASSAKESLLRGVESLDVPDRMRRYQAVFSIQTEAIIDGLFRDGLLPPHAGDRILDCWSDLAPLIAQTDELGGFQFLELRSALPDELLIYGDKLSMAHGLELRVPYLDREIVEFAQRLPARFKVRRGVRKWLHREVCRGFLPPSILRRKKRGFAVNVVDDWFRHSLSRSMDSTLLDQGALIFRYLRPAPVRDLLRQHQTGQRDNHKILFSLIVFEQWLRMSRL